MNPELIKDFGRAYSSDTYFMKKLALEPHSPQKLLTPSRFQRGLNRLLYFVDADWRTRLCVPEGQRNFVLQWLHETASESAHARPRRFLARLKELFFWPTMARDAEVYAATCDVCQEIKANHRAHARGLCPAHILARPFKTVSLDLITGLPPSGPERYTAILVVVDKLTKFAIVTPTHDTLTQEGFAQLFVTKVINVYGLPLRIIADRDRRWATAFWKSVILFYGGSMALSSSHHPQTDGQTKVLNAMLEQMLRAYVASSRDSWSKWLSEIAFSYNTAIHSSTTYSPTFLLMGYRPATTMTMIAPSEDPTARLFLPSQKGEEFVEELELHRQAARDALVLAQEQQAKTYNKGHQPVQELRVGDWALVNPHTLKLMDIAGTGCKLVQKMIGPFEVMEKINLVVYRLRLPDNYPMHPIFNLEHLHKYHQSPREYSKRTKLPSTWEFSSIGGVQSRGYTGPPPLAQKRWQLTNVLNTLEGL
jgi:hypothetical protein